MKQPPLSHEEWIAITRALVHYILNAGPDELDPHAMDALAVIDRARVDID